MNEKADSKKRRLILILILLLVLFPTAFYLTRSFWNNSPELPARTATSFISSKTPTSLNVSEVPGNPTNVEPKIQEESTNQSINDSNENFLFSMRDGNFIHLFNFELGSSQIIRLTNNDWDDIDPSLSPDGTKIAFSSNRNGYWDIYILDLISAEITQLTNSKEYDASPSWSPDSIWITFESLINSNLEIQIASTQAQNEHPILLTENTTADHSPVWSPEGRTILFVSERSGNSEIWAAHLDATENRFVNISMLPQSEDFDPAWSPDGRNITWSSQRDGISKLLIFNLDTGNLRELAIGSSPLFSSNSNLIIAQVDYPNETTIVSYLAESGNIYYPPKSMTGRLYGLSNSASHSIDIYQNYITEEAKAISSEPIGTSINNGLKSQETYQIVPLHEINANHPFLHAAVDEPFFLLHDQVEKEIGWNFLDQLDEAYYPLTEPPPPDEPESWLYTGRAIAVNSMPLFGGWMSVVREDYAGQTYWRLYLKTRFQDGSQGMPMKHPVWDFSARYSGDPGSYELGGKNTQIPDGYWVDFTEIALRFGWKRIPALINWRTYFSGTLFNQFVYMENLDWRSAMSQLYPVEALATATRIPTQTLTPTSTPIQTKTPTPVFTLTPTITLEATPSQNP